MWASFERLAVVLAVIGMLVAAAAAFLPDYQPGPFVGRSVPVQYIGGRQ